MILLMMIQLILRDVTCADVTTTDCGAITSSGAVEGASLTDGTATMASGAITAVTSLAFTGADAGSEYIR